MFILTMTSSVAVRNCLNELNVLFTKLLMVFIQSSIFILSRISLATIILLKQLRIGGKFENFYILKVDKIPDNIFNPNLPAIED